VCSPDLSLKVHVLVSVSPSGSLAPCEVNVNAVTPAMPVPVGATPIVPGVGALFLFASTTPTATAAPAAAPMMIHFFPPPPPPPPVDVTCPAGSPVVDAELLRVSLTLSAVGAPA